MKRSLLFAFGLCLSSILFAAAPLKIAKGEYPQFKKGDQAILEIDLSNTTWEEKESFGKHFEEYDRLEDMLYEVFSATGTVGLSRGVTTALSPLGRLLIIICMYLGRIGPVSLALFFGADDSAKNEIHHANGRFFVG